MSREAGAGFTQRHKVCRRVVSNS